MSSNFLVICYVVLLAIIGLNGAWLEFRRSKALTLAKVVSTLALVLCTLAFAAGTELIFPYRRWLASIWLCALAVEGMTLKGAIKETREKRTTSVPEWFQWLMLLGYAAVVIPALFSGAVVLYWSYAG